MTELVEPAAGPPRPGEAGAPVGPGGAPGWCDRCGESVAAGPHEACAAARAWEPPRWCASCRRRMKVQVLPAGWAAVCVEHGEIRG